MAEPTPTSLRVATGLGGREVLELRRLLATLSGKRGRFPDIPIIAPALLLGDPALRPYAAQMEPPSGMSMVHESQSFVRAGGVLTDTALSISANVKTNGASKVFDFSMLDEENCACGVMQTRLREVSPDDMAHFKGSAFPAHMDKGDIIWLWSEPYTTAMVHAYLALAQDPNPIHTSDDAAQSAGLSGAVVPGMFFAGVVEFMLLQALPDTSIADMKLRFMAPVLIEEALRYGVMVRAKTEIGQPKLVRVFVVRSDNVIAAIADISMQVPT